MPKIESIGTKLNLSPKGTLGTLGLWINQNRLHQRVIARNTCPIFCPLALGWAVFCS